MILLAKPASAKDVETLLCEKLGSLVVETYIKVYHERNGVNVIVKPKVDLPYWIWLLIHRTVRKMGGSYKRRERLWLVPLDREG